ncbi:uncharacterized protein LOC106069327 isoform X1 [Biomphalaria glabrata]|uniref:Uncharacterized protein LOC106069327 isoform X1 n=2 Tax=Biomphalaria glabrata TaxID=6526 RepID=A0A9W3B402_BIOGL|nr:uncharacterized protein LOC106069327 isoform X1 [Biomphalaria glabrata]
MVLSLTLPAATLQQTIYSKMNSPTIQKYQAPDFLCIDQLPEVILVQIMEFLTLQERFYLSQTCRVFCTLFTHPRLWQVADIKLVPKTIITSNKEVKCSMWSKIPVTDEILENLINRYKLVFRHLHLEISGLYRPIKDIYYSILLALSENHQLETLTLQIEFCTKVEHVEQSSLRDLYLISSLIRNAVSLRQLSIKSWPFQLETVDEDRILLSLLNNPHIVNLRTLQLFYMDVSDGPWAKQVSPLPSREVILQIVSHFKQLECLALRSSMLSDELFRQLATSPRKPLCMFKVLLVYSKEHHSNTLNSISPESWSTFSKVWPNCEVEYLITFRITLDQLQRLFSPHIKLTSLTILEYGRCDVGLIDFLITFYSKTLESFICFCESQNCDEALKRLVNSCLNLKCLVFCGSIASKTIQDIAEMIRQQNRVFTTFKFKGKNIQVDDFIEDDAVISRRADDQYHLVSLEQWHQSQETCLAKLELLSQTVFTLINCQCLLEDR